MASSVVDSIMDRFVLKAADFVDGLAALLVVIIFLIIGWLVSRVLVAILKRLMHEFKIEAIMKKHGLDDALGGFTLTEIFSIFLELATLAVFLGIAADVVHLSFLTNLVNWFIAYVPMFLQGVSIIVLALLFADYVTDKIKSHKMVPFANGLCAFFQFFVAYVALVMALPLILPGADVEILRFAFYIILGAVGIAIGLGTAIALGLGAKDTVGKMLEKKKAELERLV